MSRQKYRNKSTAELAAQLRKAVLDGADWKARQIRRELKRRETDQVEIKRPALPDRYKPPTGRGGRPMPRRKGADLSKLTTKQLEARRRDKRVIVSDRLRDEIAKRKGAK